VPGQPWAVKLFKRHRADDAAETCPAQDFLKSTPKNVAAQIIAIVDAVAASPPPQFTGGGMWEAMKGDMAGFYEARKKGPDRRLYRLFCILEQQGPGLSGPTIVVIAGMSKPVGTGFSKAEYAQIRALGDEYRRRSPRSVV
jgi:Txe/YoeB family toxin of Txe-Axe toxin-antitoxin module